MIPALTAAEKTAPVWRDEINDEIGDVAERPAPPGAVALPDDERWEMAGVDGYRYTDHGNAYRLIRAHSSHLRYVPRWGKWLAYDGGRWRDDPGETMVSYLAALIGKRLLTPENIQAAMNSSPDPSQSRAALQALIGWARRSECTTGIRGTIESAASLPGVAIDHEAIDQHAWLFNLRNGTIDLRAGVLQPHNPADLLWMQAAVAYDGTAVAPEWTKFLEQVLPDPEVRGFVQRVMGLVLVGEQLEHLLPIAIGGGANGKSTLTRIIAAILGDYAVVCSKDVLLALKHDTHPTAKAALFRRRFAHSGELPQGASLDEAQVKELTGGDRIQARRMREDPWEFDPSHILWLHANHRPAISGTDDGIWRRVKLIPFSVQIPEADRDPELANRIIRNEGPGVLNWMLHGLADYRTTGLDTPASITVATSEFRTQSDTVAAFLAESGVTIDAGLSVSTSELMQIHNEWFGANGVSGTERDHYQRVIAALKEQGISQGRTSSRGRFWRGIGVNL